MERNAKEAMRLIAGSEGGFANHPKDPGGATMKGVTLATYRAWRKRRGEPAPSVNDLKKISDEEVEAIFRANYWNRVRGDELPAGVDFAASDYAFNSGPGQAVKDLQRSLTSLGHETYGFDSVIGTKTLAALDAAGKAGDIGRLIDAYCDRRLAFMKRLKTWGTFGKGWTRRVAEVREAAKRMAAGGKKSKPPRDHPPIADRGEEPAELVADRGTAKADPSDTKALSMPGGTSTVVTVAGAGATAATTASAQLLEQSAWSPYAVWLIFGAVALTIIAAVVTAVVLKNRANDEGSV